MPVDLSGPNSIIGAYLQGLQIRKQNEARIMQLAQQEKRRQDQIAQFQERLQQEKEEFTLRQQHEKAQRDFQNFQARMALTAAMATTGQPGPGGESRQQLRTSPADVEAFLKGTPIEQLQDTILTGKVPGSDEETTLNISDYYRGLQRRGEVQATIEGQKETARQKARQPFRIDELAAQAKAVADRTKQRQEFQAGENRLNREAADKRANEANRVRQLIANARLAVDKSEKEARLQEVTGTIANAGAPIDTLSTGERSRVIQHIARNPESRGYYTTQHEKKLQESANAFATANELEMFAENLKNKAPASKDIASRYKRVLTNLTNEDRIQLENLSQALAATVGRSADERGAFAIADRETYKKLLPSYSKSDDRNLDDLDTLRDLMLKRAYAAMPNINIKERDKFFEEKFGVPVRQFKVTMRVRRGSK